MVGETVPREIAEGRVYSAGIIRKYAEMKCFAEAFAAADSWIDESIALLFGAVFHQVPPSIIAMKLVQAGKSSVPMAMLYAMRDFAAEAAPFKDEKYFQEGLAKALRSVEAFKSWRNLVVHNYGYRKLAIRRQHKRREAQKSYFSTQEKFNEESERILNSRLDDGMSCVKQLQDLYKAATMAQK